MYQAGHGYLITHFAGQNGKMLEAECRDDDWSNMAAEEDEHGNFALHYFVSNRSYISDTPRNSTEVDARHMNIWWDYEVTYKLWHAHPPALSTPNRDNQLPLQIALLAGREQIVSFLLIKYPEAALRVNSMDNIHVFIHLLGYISIENRVMKVYYPGECFSTMYFLVRLRPDIVGYGMQECLVEHATVFGCIIS